MVWPVHNRFVVRGGMGTTKEIWSNTLHFRSDTIAQPDINPADWNTAAVTSAVNNFYASSYFHSNVKVLGWRGYNIGTNGRLVGNKMQRVDYDTAASGTSTSSPYPFQIACVISLHAPNRGPAPRGRVYLPTPTLSLTQATGQWASGDCDALLAAFKTYIEALLNATTPSFTTGEGLCNVSPMDTGHRQEVTEYRCGLVPDTMRSRRNKLTEDYEVLSA